MQRDTIVRSALGSHINLGILYDACNERSCNISLLKTSPPPANCINSTEIPTMETAYIHLKSSNDKCHLLNVTSELQLSLLSGLTECFGSTKYFQTDKSSARSVSVSLAIKVTTKHESLSILDPKFREIIILDALTYRSATHVVTGITWGANLIVTAEYQNEEKKDAQLVAGNLQATLKRISIGAAYSKFAEDTTENSKLELKIVGDVLPTGQIPGTIEGAIALIAQLSKLTTEYNSGKGVPVRYELTSLESIQSYLKIGVKAHILFCPLEEDAILRVTQVFDEIAEANLMLNDFCNDVNKFQDHLPETMLDEARRLQQGAQVVEAKFRGQLKTLLVEVRSGKADVAKLDDLRKGYESELYSAPNVFLTLKDDPHGVQLKIEELQCLKALGVTIIPKNTGCRENKLLEYKGKEVYVLFGESEAIAMDNGKIWRKHLGWLTRHLELGYFKFGNVLFVDLDFSPHFKPCGIGNEESKICIQKFNKNGECVDYDLLKPAPPACKIQ